MLKLISDALREAWQSFDVAIVAFLPRFIAMLTIVLAGWLLAYVLGWITRRVLGWLPLNALVDRAGGGEVLRRAGMPPPNRIAGWFVFWLVLIGFLLAGLKVAGLTGMDLMIADFVRFIPRIGVALVILVVGFAVATFAWRATLLAAVNASFEWARLLSEIVRFLILSLAMAMALEQVAVAREVVITAFAITFGAVMLGLAIAIGIGGSGLVRRTLEKKFENPKEQAPDPRSHL